MGFVIHKIKLKDSGNTVIVVEHDEETIGSCPQKAFEFILITDAVNGDYKPLSEASVNVLDRGFTFGDGVYEVIPVFNRKIFRFDEHMRRPQVPPKRPRGRMW